MSKIRATLSAALDRISSATKSDARYVGRGVIWLSLAQGLTALTALAVSVAFARFMAPETFGTYKYALSLAGIFAALSLTGLSTAVAAASARGSDGALAQGTRLALRWNLPAGILAALCGAYYLYLGNGTLGWSLVILGLTQPLVDAVALVFSFISGKKLFRAKATFTLVHGSLYAAAVILAVVTTGSATVAIAAGVLGNLAGYASLYVFARRRYVAPAAPADAALSGYAKHLSLMNVLGTVVGQIDKVLLFQYVGPAQVALWSFAQAPVSQVRQISKVLSGVILPKVATIPLGSLRETAWRRAASIFALAAAAYISYWFLAPYFFEIFFPAYASAVGPSRVYALAILTMPVVLFRQSLIGHRKTRELYIIDVAQPLAKLGMLAAALPWGVVGIAVAATAAEFLSLALSVILFERSSRPSAPAA